jgi:hypothetical protein
VFCGTAGSNQATQLAHVNIGMSELHRIIRQQSSMPGLPVAVLKHTRFFVRQIPRGGLRSQ